jgi:hypothetical protein
MVKKYGRKKIVKRKRRLSFSSRMLGVLKGIFSLMLIISIPVMIFLSAPRLITIQEIRCTNQFGKCSEIIQEEVNAHVGESLLKVEDGLGKLFTNDPNVKGYSLQYQFPNHMEVYLVEKTAKYAYVERGESFYFLIDDAGNVLNKVERTNLPVVEGETGLAVGSKVDSDLLIALKMYYALERYNNPKKAIVDGDVMRVEFPEGYDVLFPIRADIDILLGSYNLIMLQLNSEGEDTRIENSGKLKEIDLRFKNPVLRFE